MSKPFSDVLNKVSINPPALPDIGSMVAQMEASRREKEATDLGFAHVMYDRLVKQIKDFEQTLKPNEEVGAYLSSFGAKILILIENIGYHNPYFIVFNGINVDDSQRVRLVQHTSQISVLLTVMQVKEERKANRIGFAVEPDEKEVSK